MRTANELYAKNYAGSQSLSYNTTHPSKTTPAHRLSRQRCIWRGLVSPRARVRSSSRCLADDRSSSTHIRGIDRHPAWPPPTNLGGAATHGHPWIHECVVATNLLFLLFFSFQRLFYSNLTHPLPCHAVWELTPSWRGRDLPPLWWPLVLENRDQLMSL